MQFECTQCKKLFSRNTSWSNQTIKKKWKPFCSKICQDRYKCTKIKSQCGNCGKEIYTVQSDVASSQSGKNFCSRHCSVTYHNLHGTKNRPGHRVSKLELYLQKQLIILYPNMTILFNNKNIINSELDIYIPSLKLAFELNGIFHYEPIYGQEKLKSIQNNDKRKFQACIEHQIELCLIDTTSQKYFKEKTSQKFLDIVTKIINQKLDSSGQYQSCADNNSV